MGLETKKKKEQVGMRKITLFCENDTEGTGKHNCAIRKEKMAGSIWEREHKLGATGTGMKIRSSKLCPTPHLVLKETVGCSKSQTVLLLGAVSFSDFLSVGSQ